MNRTDASVTPLGMVLSYCRAFVLRTRTRGEAGASLVEYALLLSLIAVVCLGAVTMIGGITDANLSDTASKLP